MPAAPIDSAECRPVEAVSPLVRDLVARIFVGGKLPLRVDLDRFQSSRAAVKVRLIEERFADPLYLVPDVAMEPTELRYLGPLGDEGDAVVVVCEV